MKSAVLVLMALFPLSLAAQMRTAGDAANQNATDTLSYVGTVHANDSVDSMSPDAAADIGLAESDPQGKAGAQAGPSAKQVSEPQPLGPVKMVGYVDSAVIDSEIRIRAEEGFHDLVPDRTEFFYPQCSCTNVSGAPGKDFPGAANNVNFGQVYLYGEYAPVARLSVFVEVPFRWIQPLTFINGSFGSNETPDASTIAGLSDVRAGIKLAILQTTKHTLTLQLKAYFPTGNATNDLGTGHYSFEPSLLYYQRLSRRWVVESQIGDWHPVGGSTGSLYGSGTASNFAGDVLLYGVGPSYQLITGERFRFAPVLEMFGWHVFGGLETLASSFVGSTICTGESGGCSFSAAGINIVNLKAGLRFGFGSHNSVYLGFGQQLTHEGWYKNIVRAEYRYAF